jgi:hypothetical protein
MATHLGALAPRMALIERLYSRRRRSGTDGQYPTSSVAACSAARSSLYFGSVSNITRRSAGEGQPLESGHTKINIYICKLSQINLFWSYYGRQGRKGQPSKQEGPRQHPADVRKEKLSEATRKCRVRLCESRKHTIGQQKLKSCLLHRVAERQSAALIRGPKPPPVVLRAAVALLQAMMGHLFHSLRTDVRS